MSLEGSFVESLQLGGSLNDAANRVELSCVHPVPVAVTADSFRIKDKLKEAYLVGQSVVSFTDNFGGCTKQDVLNSYSLAVQVANHDVPDRNGQFGAWLNRFQEVMESIGYDTQPAVLQDHHFHFPTFTVGEFVLGQFDRVVTEGSREAMKASFEGLRLVQCCSSNATSAATASLQFVPCDVTENGAVELPICSLKLNVDRAEYNILGYGPQINAAAADVLTANVTYVFNEEKYAIVREEVIKKLIAMGDPIIGDLNI